MYTQRWLRAVLGAGAVFALVSATARPLLGQATGTIRGTVRNAEDNAPIGGARISIEALRMAGLTNEDGRYELRNVPAGPQSVTVRFIGFRVEMREVLSNPGQTTVADFQMRAQALMMSEVVITGVSEATSRAKLPFTVAKVTTEAIPIPPTVALGSIKGKVAGVNLITGTQPGEGSSIVLRSPTSIFKESSPLIVVDGAILTESSVDVSSLEIESVEIIKGAAAASLYGSRAGAGVIQIRTNRGSQIQEGRTRLIVRSEYGTNEIMRPIEWASRHNLAMTADSSAYICTTGQTACAAGDPTLDRQNAASRRIGFQDQRYPTATYDHIAELFDPGQYMTNSLSIGHNSGTTSWLATASQHKTAGVVKENDGYGRYDFKVNLDHRVTNDLSVSMSAFHMESKQEDPGGDTFFDFIHQAPDVDLLQPDPDGTPYMFQPDPLGIRANPLYQMATQEHWDYRGRTVGSMDLRFNPWPWLGFTANGSYDRSDRRNEDWVPRGVKTPESPTGSVGSSSLFTGQTEGINASAGLTVTRAFGDLETRTSARMLVEHQDNKTVTANADVALVGGIPDLDAFSTLENTSLEERIRSRGFYLTTDLDYGERYIISALARRDGSSLFGSEERWHWYYRASGAWRMSAETWWPFPNTLSEFKLRYSRGTAGGRPDFEDRFEVFNLGTSGISLGTLGNVFLKPERTTEQEFGIDAVAFERFSLNLSYAKQRTVDQLIEVPLPALYGFVAQWQNAGTLEGHTYEATLDGHLIETDKVRWGVTLIADRSRNRLVEYARPCHAEGLLGNRCPGQVLGEMWGQRLWQSLDDLPARHANSQDAFDINDDGLLVPVGAGNTYLNGVTGGVADSLWRTNVVIDGVSYAWGMPQRVQDATGQPARMLIGDANPDLNWGFSSQLRVGQLNLYALIGGQIGGNVYNSTKQRMYQYSRHREEDQAGKPEELKKPSTYYTGALYNGNLASQWFVEDATYTKLREVSVRFALTPRQLPSLQRLGMDRVMLALIGRNLHEWTNYSGYDAEVGNVIERRDNFGFPTYRTFTFSVEIEF